ncbi:MAG TPA: hypothetical protein VFJ16_08465 [Longimicrobium sp.]|nr:hypothetical protein [Longimicrobium sp.]
MEQTQLDIAAVRELLRQIDERSRLDPRFPQNPARADESSRRTPAAVYRGLGLLLVAAMAAAVAAAMMAPVHSGSVAVLIAMLLFLLVVLRYFTADR